jgi:hypothetical protein
MQVQEGGEALQQLLREDPQKELITTRRVSAGIAVCALLCLVNTPVLAAEPDTLALRVSLLVFDPLADDSALTVREAIGWGDPLALTSDFIASLREASHGLVSVTVVDTVVSTEFPPKTDGFRYSCGEYLAHWRAREGWHRPDLSDYRWIIREFGLARKIDDGVADEIWMWGGPYFGFWESTMAGPRAYFCNSDPVEGVESTKPFVIMGYSYERGVGEMLENLGHRTESILTHVYGGWAPESTHAWNRFTLYDKVLPGKAACGNVHFAPNSETDYDWGNPRQVWSTCDDWLSYPELTGARRLVDCAEWGNGDIRLHHEWWFRHLPHVAGRTNGMLNNWWAYVFEFHRYPEGQ